MRIVDINLHSKVDAVVPVLFFLLLFSLLDINSACYQKIQGGDDRHYVMIRSRCVPRFAAQECQRW